MAKSKRMTAEQRKQSIVDAAIKQFAKNGYNGTVIRDISREAGINEALLYRYFPGKEALFSAALDEMIGKIKEMTYFGRLANAEIDIHKLPEVAESALAFMTANPPLTRMLLYSGLQKHELAAPFFDSVSRPALQRISELVRKQQEELKMHHDIDPFMGAVAFLAPIIFLNIARNIFQHELFKGVDVGEFARTISKIYLRGMAAHGDDENER